MKYAIPILESNGKKSRVGEHFGRVQFYAIWDADDDSIEIVRNESSHMGGRGLPAEFLANICNAIICKGIGSRAISLCNQLGVKVFMGAAETVEETIDLFKNGVLKEASANEGCLH
jgi:predicted Fe-Mo cluster-binding NifX family protein